MLTREENELLCRVGPGTAMGQMMRRYWFPALLSEELPEADGPPKRVRLLGEDLVAFRDSDGQVGILDEYCPHRGASLVLARNESNALQCIYHGWRVARDGAIIETPCEPETSDFRSRVRALAYHVREVGGVIWTYMGPPRLEPPFPNFEWTALPAQQRSILKIQEDCNWVQGLEGVIDSAHSNFLHADDIRPSAEASVLNGTSHYVKEGEAFLQRPSNDGRPRMEAQNTSYGFRYAAIRNPLKDPDRYQYVRTTLFAAPFYAFFPPPEGWLYMQCWVPIDDTSSMFYFIQCDLAGPVDHQRLRKRSGAQLGIDIDANFRKIRTRDNDWLQDRDAMKNGSFSGIKGVQNQDIAVQESMGAIYDRTREHLGTSDLAVIRMRRLMLDAARRVQAGGVPLGLEQPVQYDRLRGEERIIPREVPWQTVGAFAGESTVPDSAEALAVER